MTSNKPGQPLPYDRRMGITQAQYQQLQHMKSEAHPGEAVKIEVKRAADGGIMLVPQDEAGAALKDISFPSDEKEAQDPGRRAVDLQRHSPEGCCRPDRRLERRGMGRGRHHRRQAQRQDRFRQARGRRIRGDVLPGVAYAGHKEQSIVVFYPLD